MVAWWTIPVALFIGVFVGISIIALCGAGSTYSNDDEGVYNDDEQCQQGKR
jgi:hypothetical protein